MKIKYSIFDRFRIPAYDKSSQMQTGDLIFDPEKCNGCGTCVQICPGGCLLTETTTKVDILSGKAKGGKYGVPHVVQMKKGATLCIACFDCGTACPRGAISIKHNFNPGYHFKRLTQTSDMRYPKRG
ncbi:MAG: 4Fe-4S binding protein [Spirochaetes bacterium]|nr:4Fe-4S binding protein [Spirochaetota bacterium]